MLFNIPKYLNFDDHQISKKLEIIAKGIIDTLFQPNSNSVFQQAEYQELIIEAVKKIFSRYPNIFRTEFECFIEKQLRTAVLKEKICIEGKILCLIWLRHLACFRDGLMSMQHRPCLR